MAVIHFDNPETWLDLVESALQTPDAYLERLREAGIECAYGDCSGLDRVFDRHELKKIIENIEAVLTGCSARLYHGCRFYEESPADIGLRASSIDGIEMSLMNLAEQDPILSNHIDDIRIQIGNDFCREQARCRNRQIWFCLTQKEMINEGGVYIAFGSEYRLLILNAVNENLKQRLFHYGTPAAVVVDLPIDSFLAEHKTVIAKFLFALWIHNRFGFSDYHEPNGFSCYIEEDVPPAHVVDILRPERVYDQYNADSRWYSWDEICPRERV